MYNYWWKRELKTDFEVNGWMLCVITHIHKDVIDNSYCDHRKHVNNVIKKLFYVLYEDELHANLDFFGVSMLTSIIIMLSVMVMKISGKSKTSATVIVICGIISIHYREPMLLVLYHVELHQRLLLLVLLKVLGVM